MKNGKISLNDLCELIIDCEHKTAPTENYDTGFYSIRTPNIGRGRLILENANCVSDDTYEKWTRRAIPQSDDLILAREAPVGNVAIVPPGLKVCLGQRTVLIRPDKEIIEPEYLVYLMNSNEIQEKFHGYSGGATVAHLNMRDIRSLEMPELPPIKVQRKIANVLSAYDDLIENNTRRIAILEEMAQTLYREWFVHFRFPGHEDVALVDVGGNGRLPEGWENIRLEDFIDFKSGFAFKSKTFDEEGQYGLVTISNVQDGQFVQECKNHLAELPDKMPDYCFLKTGDILLSLTGNIGRACFVVGDNYLLNQRVAKLVPLKNAGRAFIYCTFREETMRTRLEQIATGVAQQNLSPVKTSKLEFILPKQSLLQEFESKANPLLEQMLILWKKNTNLRQTRDLLLPRLISGELDISQLEIVIPS